MLQSFLHVEGTFVRCMYWSGICFVVSIGIETVLFGGEAMLLLIETSILSIQSVQAGFLIGFVYSFVAQCV